MPFITTAPGCHDAAVADPGAGQDGGAAADPNIFPDGYVINDVIGVVRPRSACPAGKCNGRDGYGELVTMYTSGAMEQ